MAQPTRSLEAGDTAQVPRLVDATAILFSRRHTRQGVMFETVGAANADASGIALTHAFGSDMRSARGTQS